MIRTQIQLTEKQLQSLRDVASDRGISVAEIVRECVDLYLRTKPRVDDEQLRIQARELAGKFHSGSDDLGSQHDRHLEDAFRK